MSLIDGQGRPMQGSLGGRRAITKAEAEKIATEIAVKVAEYYMVQVPPLVARLLVSWGVMQEPPTAGQTEGPSDTPERADGESPVAALSRSQPEVMS